MKILIPDLITIADVEKEIFGNEYEIITPNATHSDQIPQDVWQSASAVLAYDQIKFDQQLIDQF